MCGEDISQMFRQHFKQLPSQGPTNKMKSIFCISVYVKHAKPMPILVFFLASLMAIKNLSVSKRWRVKEHATLIGFKNS